MLRASSTINPNPPPPASHTPNLGQVQNLEKEIVNILTDADPMELNYMLPKIGLGLLFYKVKDHAPINLHRTRLLNVLADNRISVRGVFLYSTGPFARKPMITKGGSEAARL